MLFYYIFGLQDRWPKARMYSCDGTLDTSEKNVLVGLLYLGLGIFYQLCYVPCIVVMSRKPLIDMPCFKLMVYLGFIDVSCLFICADLAGIQSLTGLGYCDFPSFAFVAGALSMGFWSATCFCCVFLAFNRWWDLSFPNHNILFEGYRMYAWLVLPTIYFIFFTFFEKPLIYYNDGFTFLFDPKTNISAQLTGGRDDSVVYKNLPHSINNFIVIVALVSFYCVICYQLYIRSSIATSLSTMKKQIITQSLAICGCHIVGCTLYVVCQYVPVPIGLSILSNLAWIGNHGLPGVVYISLNRTIRAKVLDLLGIRKFHGRINSTSQNKHHQSGEKKVSVSFLTPSSRTAVMVL